MPVKFDISPLGWAARTADVLMTPIMYLAAGTFRESPQRTHRWNNKKLKSEDVQPMNRLMMAYCLGVSKAISKRGLRFHIPIFGGWRDYVVLRPKTRDGWHVGWIAGDAVGVSRIRLTGPVRMLLGTGSVDFFAIDARSRLQIPLEKVGEGRIGSQGPYSHFPLL